MPYRKTIDTLLVELQTGPVGLTGEEADRRLTAHGWNRLETESKINPLAIFFNQFKSFIIYILLFAVLFSVLIGEYVDSAIILAILMLNALIGFFQELSANKSLEALKQMSAVRARVIRDGREVVLDAKYIVPGDIIILEAGDKVPADARIIKAVRLKAEEAALTGESLPSDKNAETITAEVQVGDRANMLFASTPVVTGNGRAVVTATGMQTEIGKITRLLKETEEEMTPLQKRLDLFGKKLGGVIIGICAFIFMASCGKEYFSGTITLQSFIVFAFIAISLAVAAVPTALPAVVTIALSIGVKRLLQKKALVRKLSSVETLGSCDVICTDKTGTLTENQMTVRRAWTLAEESEITGAGYALDGEIITAISALLFKIGVICNNASLLTEDENGRQVSGDPTEAALLVSGVKAGIAPTVERLDEIPFDSERKLMSVLVLEDGQRVMYVKGATGELLKRCNRVLVDGSVNNLDAESRARILRQNDLYAEQALRVLAFAYKPLAGGDEFVEDGLVFVGLQAMIDPPRADVIESLKKTELAGIRVIMITGDYQETARAIGREIGIVGGLVCTGSELEGMDEDALIERLKSGTNIFARVVPEQKLKIVGALQKMGHTVAMTGDGVNDAPALKKANIGVAVGSGTEVAKEAADFVLLDDSFSNIVNAIEEGRGIYDNIQKSIMLLLSGNFGEVLIIFLAVILGLNLPLTAILLLWINMVTDGAPALAYSVDPYGSNIMFRKPKPRNEGILPVAKLVLIAVLGTVGSMIALGLFSLFGGNSDTASELVRAQTMVFNFVVLYELILVFVIRYGYRVPFFSNIWIWLSVVGSLALQALLMYTPLYEVFKIKPLDMVELGSLLAAGLLFYFLSLLYDFAAGKISFLQAAKNG